MAVGYNFQGSLSEYGEYGCRLDPMAVTKTGTQEYDGACLGLVFIRRWVLEAMQTTYNPGEYFWFDWNGRNSQDVVFYFRALQAGARTGVDRDNAVGHVGKKIYTMQDFWAMRDKHKEEEQQEA